jgi:hypothetical protein
MTKGAIIGTLTKWPFGMDFFKASWFKIWLEPVLVGHGPKQKKGEAFNSNPNSKLDTWLF